MFGRTAYILDGAVKLGKTKSYHIKVQTDLETWEQDCILGMVTNAKSVAGLKLYKKNSVSLKDGLLDGIFCENTEKSD